MDREANYIAVGIFVVLVVTLAATFLWWYAGNREAGEVRRYQINFQGSVSGLTRGSPVRYLGVNVGRVARIQLDPDNPSTVIVLADVQEGTPIFANTEATLQLQGITGLLYVELDQGPGPWAELSVPETAPYPVIRTSTSELDKIVASLPELLDAIGELLTRAITLLDDDNMAALSRTASRLDAASERLPEVLDETTALLRDARGTIERLTGAVERVDGIVRDTEPQIEDALEQLSQAAGHLAGLAARLDGLVARNADNLGDFLEVGLYEVTELVAESRAAVEQIEKLARSLEQNPSQLLYESDPQGVEIAP